MANIRSSLDELPKFKKYLDPRMSDQERLELQTDYERKRFHFLYSTLKEMRQETEEKSEDLLLLKAQVEELIVPKTKSN